MADADDDDLGALLQSMYADLQAMNIRVGALLEVLKTNLGVTDEQYAVALAKATAAAQISDGQTKH